MILEGELKIQLGVLHLLKFPSPHHRQAVCVDAALLVRGVVQVLFLEFYLAATALI